MATSTELLDKISAGILDVIEPEVEYNLINQILNSLGCLRYEQIFKDWGLSDHVICSAMEINITSMPPEVANLQHRLSIYNAILTVRIGEPIVDNSSQQNDVMTPSGQSLETLPKERVDKGFGLVRGHQKYIQLNPWPLSYHLPTFDQKLSAILNSGQLWTHSSRILVVNALKDDLDNYFGYSYPTSKLEIVCREFSKTFPHLKEMRNEGFESLMDSIRQKKSRDRSVENSFGLKQLSFDVKKRKNQNILKIKNNF